MTFLKFKNLWIEFERNRRKFDESPNYTLCSIALCFNFLFQWKKSTALNRLLTLKDINKKNHRIWQTLPLNKITSSFRSHVQHIKFTILSSKMYTCIWMCTTYGFIMNTSCLKPLTRQASSTWPKWMKSTFGFLKYYSKILSSSVNISHTIFDFCQLSSMFYFWLVN